MQRLEKTVKIYEEDILRKNHATTPAQENTSDIAFPAC